MNIPLAGEQAVSTAPWWASGVFGLTGALLTVLVGLYLERRRSKREAERRWDNQRLQAIVAFLEAGRTYVPDLHAAKGDDPKIEVYQRYWALGTQLEFLLPNDLNDKMAEVLKAAGKVVDFYTDDPQQRRGRSREGRELIEAYGRTYRYFHEALRVAMGVVR